MFSTLSSKPDSQPATVLGNRVNPFESCQLLILFPLISPSGLLPFVSQVCLNFFPLNSQPVQAELLPLDLHLHLHLSLPLLLVPLLLLIVVFVVVEMLQVSRIYSPSLQLSARSPSAA